MSFSSELKESLSKTNNLSDKNAVKYETIGYLISNNTTYNKKKIKYSTENEYNINRFSKLISNLGFINFDIDLNGKIYKITLPRIENINEIQYIDDKIEIKEESIINEIGEKAIIRGAFLGSGSLNNPQNKYHLEILFSTQNNLKYISKLLEKYSITTKKLIRKNGYSLYIKDGEEISKFLALIGANLAVLKFEEIRVLRDIKNNVNRKVNCETANLSKTISASVKQIETIKRIQKEGKFENLSDNLKEIAILRLENPDASLIELGKMLKNPIGKSGVNHRLKQLELFFR